MQIEDKDYIEAKQRLIAKSLSEERYYQLTQKERYSYAMSLKVDRDFVNSYETAYKQGYQRGVAKSLLNVLDNETIALKTGLGIEEIEKLR